MSRRPGCFFSDLRFLAGMGMAGAASGATRHLSPKGSLAQIAGVTDRRLR